MILKQINKLRRSPEPSRTYNLIDKEDIYSFECETETTDGTNLERKISYIHGDPDYIVTEYTVVSEEGKTISTGRRVYEEQGDQYLDLSKDTSLDKSSVISTMFEDSELSENGVSFPA